MISSSLIIFSFPRVFKVISFSGNSDVQVFFLLFSHVDAERRKTRPTGMLEMHEENA